MLEHQIVAVRVQELHVRVTHREQDIRILDRDAGVVLRRDVGERLLHQVKAALDRGQEELLLGTEEAEHVGLRHANSPCYPVDGGAVEPAEGELVHGCLDERVPALGSRDALARVCACRCAGHR